MFLLDDGILTFIFVFRWRKRHLYGRFGTHHFYRRLQLQTRIQLLVAVQGIEFRLKVYFPTVVFKCLLHYWLCTIMLSNIIVRSISFALSGIIDLGSGKLRYI